MTMTLNRGATYPSYYEYTCAPSQNYSVVPLRVPDNFGEYAVDVVDGVEVDNAHPQPLHAGSLEYLHFCKTTL